MSNEEMAAKRSKQEERGKGGAVDSARWRRRSKRRKEWRRSKREGGMAGCKGEMAAGGRFRGPGICTSLFVTHSLETLS